MSAPPSLLPPFIPLRPIARWVTFLLLATVVVAWVSVGFDVADVRLIRRVAMGRAITPERMLAHQRTGLALGVVQAALLLATGALFIAWNYRARVNLRALGVRHLSYPRSWAISGFLIPGLNLLRPYQVLGEVWKASRPDADRFEWREGRTPGVLRLWWITFDAFLVLELLSLAMTASAGSELLRRLMASGSMLLADAAAAVAASIALFVVRGITAAQHAKWERFRSETEPGGEADAEGSPEPGASEAEPA